MKIIKRERQVRLDELLKYVWDNDINNESFFTKESEGHISVDSDGDFCMYGRPHVNKDELFTITEEMEITEDIPLNLVVVDDENQVTDENETKISSLKRDAETWGYEIKFIYLQNEDGSIGELIWDKERGLL